MKVYLVFEGSGDGTRRARGAFTSLKAAQDSVTGGAAITAMQAIDSWTQGRRCAPFWQEVKAGSVRREEHGTVSECFVIDEQGVSCFLAVVREVDLFCDQADPLVAFALAALAGDGPERDAIRDILKS